MNWYHRRLCSSAAWARSVEEQLLPWSLEGVELGDDVLEIGPGYGANLRVLVRRAPRMTALEIDGAMLDGLRAEHGASATLVHGDGTAMPFGDGSFSSVVCFTMLHHLPTPELQDALFAEALRVLRPGGTFAGSDGVRCTRMRLIHLRDTFNPIPPDTLAPRLRATGFADVSVARAANRQRFRAVKG